MSSADRSTEPSEPTNFEDTPLEVLEASKFLQLMKNYGDQPNRSKICIPPLSIDTRFGESSDTYDESETDDELVVKRRRSLNLLAEAVEQHLSQIEAKSSCMDEESKDDESETTSIMLEDSRDTSNTFNRSMQDVSSNQAAMVIDGQEQLPSQNSAELRSATSPGLFNDPSSLNGVGTMPSRGINDLVPHLPSISQGTYPGLDSLIRHQAFPSQHLASAAAAMIGHHHLSHPQASHQRRFTHGLNPSLMMPGLLNIRLSSYPHGGPTMRGSLPDGQPPAMERSSLGSQN
jgi:hypothetical protein